jgi:hypothetical protein
MRNSECREGVRRKTRLRRTKKGAMREKSDEGRRDFEKM